MAEEISVDIAKICIDKFQFKYQIEDKGLLVIVISSANTLLFIDHRWFAHILNHLKLSDYTLEVILDDIESIRNTFN